MKKYDLFRCITKILDTPPSLSLCACVWGGVAVAQKITNVESNLWTIQWDTEYKDVTFVVRCVISTNP